MNFVQIDHYLINVVAVLLRLPVATKLIQVFFFSPLNRHQTKPWQCWTVQLLSLYVSTLYFYLTFGVHWRNKAALTVHRRSQADRQATHLLSFGVHEWQKWWHTERQNRLGLYQITISTIYALRFFSHTFHSLPCWPSEKLHESVIIYSSNFNNLVLRNV